MEHWVVRTVSGAGLGKIEFRHVHADGTEHETDTTLPPGYWASEVGTVPEGAKVVCRSCGIEHQPGDDVRASFEI